MRIPIGVRVCVSNLFLGMCVFGCHSRWQTALILVFLGIKLINNRLITVINLRKQNFCSNFTPIYVTCELSLRERTKYVALWGTNVLYSSCSLHHEQRRTCTQLHWATEIKHTAEMYRRTRWMNCVRTMVNVRQKLVSDIFCCVKLVVVWHVLMSRLVCFWYE